ncbi:helix-turn-helix transcriptional regulator [Limibacillus halophilus]|uniref:Helix-turn-helix domain-containing protein n=1 Tax=Limibacillus halophilus TaxID=1579333 RepID=A0A839SMB0_9PROT|nr:helix-turn-helix domain-containing protein [Limibacillus halophilus]MBB3063961.1 hypothetical protein [Limibacillus halophilus]
MTPTELNQVASQAYYDQLLKEREAAEFLGFTVRALQNWRVRGGGPEFIRSSSRAIRYQRRDLIAWADARRCRTTTDAA